MHEKDTNNAPQTRFSRWLHGPSTPAPASVETQAEQGNADAQFHLGLSFAGADGPVQDFGQAAKWYRKAADQNHALAQFNLGAMYAGGQGMPPDERAAEVWFGKAAQQGDAGAQHHLGMSRYRASLHGVPEALSESQIEAFKWFALAAAQGYRGSETARDTLALKMTHAEVTEATQRVGRFMPAVGGNPNNQ